MLIQIQPPQVSTCTGVRLVQAEKAPGVPSAPFQSSLSGMYMACPSIPKVQAW